MCRPNEAICRPVRGYVSTYQGNVLPIGRPVRSTHKIEPSRL